MNIMLVAQCSKRALVETRRILDQFAERRGDRTWQTAITLEGLNTLRRLLRKTARRNTAVACHWIKGANQTELLWIVGNQRSFNRQGAVPTNATQRDILRQQDEDQWRSAECISLLAAIAGLFHDFGKANALFQQGLRGQAKGYQPYRHEWVSLRLFCAWVGGRDDREWLAALSEIDADDDARILNALAADDFMPDCSPFAALPPLATTVAWLIVSHHRLPTYLGVEYAPDPMQMDIWLTRQLDAVWNATHHQLTDWSQADREAVWTFPDGTPIRSRHWRAKAHKFARRALLQPALLQYGVLQQRFTSHMARLTLMLADHHYSSLPTATTAWQDDSYGAYANSDRQSGRLKQKLDEHTIGVGQNALLLGRSLSKIRRTLPAITRHKGFQRRSTQERFRWQDKAFDVASALRERSARQGFFGVNMASTGCGKTFANARIMYALADEALGCRFSVALGLRTLTLQTGDALRDKLHLQDDDLAVLIGSAAVSQLHQLRQEEAAPGGSASTEALLAEHHYVSYEGSLDDGRLSRWLQNRTPLNKLLSAPVLVTTIDHLIGATEGVRGGQQIAPMLRLLTADLVLDEPDDFDLNDLPALCRLVNWAGMLGSRVLLSSATLPPALIEALFNAYRAGRQDYQQVCGQPDTQLNVCCAWFDEYEAMQQDIVDAGGFKLAHGAFVARRVERLGVTPVLRQMALMPVESPSQRPGDVLDSVAAAFSTAMQRLHHDHHQCHPSGQRVSLGVVRMANIDPLVAVAQRLMNTPSPADTRVHYCVYHSQHPLMMRSHIEQRLDQTLTRYDPQALWQIPEIAQALRRYPEQNQLFVVLATSVAEVGRDHDYDWALAEPSSMRSLIQLAGRIQRHRRQPGETANLWVLRQNIRALRGAEPAYTRPGFESAALVLNSHDLNDILRPEQYQAVSAIPRIQERRPLSYKENFVDLEHYSLRVKLQGLKGQKTYYAAQWWREQATWSGEQQRLTPFRYSAPDERHYLWIAEEGDTPCFKFPDLQPGQWRESAGFRAVPLILADGVSAWFRLDYFDVYQRLAEQLNKELSDISQQFGEVCLRRKEGDALWHYHPLLGVFGALE